MSRIAIPTLTKPGSRDSKSSDLDSSTIYRLDKKCFFNSIQVEEKDQMRRYFFVWTYASRPMLAIGAKFV